MGWMTYGTAGLALALSLADVAPASAQAADNGPASVAVIGFDYSDSSGEVEDQSAEHAARVAAFRNQLRDGITASGRFRAVELPCVETSGCTRGTARADHLLKEAREAGADVLGVSLVTNLAAGMTGQPLSHDEVLAAGRQSATRMGSLLASVIARL